MLFPVMSVHEKWQTNFIFAHLSCSVQISAYLSHVGLYMYLKRIRFFLCYSVFYRSLSVYKVLLNIDTYRNMYPYLYIYNPNLKQSFVLWCHWTISYTHFVLFYFCILLSCKSLQLIHGVCDSSHVAYGYSLGHIISCWESKLINNIVYELF
jgi:hypothetical protein